MGFLSYACVFDGVNDAGMKHLCAINTLCGDNYVSNLADGQLQES